jgi:hypothetical protein
MALSMDLERKVDWLLAAERDSIVASHLDEPLTRLGLAQIAPRRWVDGSAPPARRLFEMALVKGASIKAHWGFSLDFVPHFSGGRICWHRTDRTAKLDVFVDPRDCGHACFLYGATWLHRDLDQLIPATVEQARETWRRGSTWFGMLSILHEIRERKSNCLGFENYTQLPLALIFLTAKIGKLTTARAELERYIRRHRVAEDVVRRLEELMRALARA